MLIFCSGWDRCMFQMYLSLWSIRHYFHLCMLWFSQNEPLRAETLQGFRIEKHSERWNWSQRYIKPKARTLERFMKLCCSLICRQKDWGVATCSQLCRKAYQNSDWDSWFLICMTFAYNPLSPQPKGNINIQYWDIGCHWKHLRSDYAGIPGLVTLVFCLEMALKLAVSLGKMLLFSVFHCRFRGKKEGCS